MLCLTDITMKAVREKVGVGLVVRYQPKEWIIKSTRFHGKKVVSCKVIAGSKQKRFIGAYVPPFTLDHLSDL